MDYAIDFPATPVLPVAESNQVLPVDRIYCVGPVQRGDKLEGHVDGVGDLTIAYAK